MTEQPLDCPDCGAPYTSADNYCRQCGMYVAALREMPLVKAAPLNLPARPARAPLPAPVKKAATALAIGTALQIGVNIAGKLLAGEAKRQATNAIRPRALAKRESAPSTLRTVAQQPSDPIAVSETVMIRRVWIRRS
jgi:hypothetical protein